MKFSQKIGCNVNDCEHNCEDDCTCTLDKIQVTPCGGKGSKTPEDETACGMYSYSGKLYEEQTKVNKQT